MKTKISGGSWLVPALVAAVIAAYFAFIFLPGRKAIGQLRSGLTTQEDYIAQAEALEPVLQTTRKLLDETLEYYSSWEEHAPAEGELSTVFGEISALALAAGTTTTKFDPESIVKHDEIRQVPLSVGCTGTLAQICRFLRGMEGLPQEIWVEDIGLETSGQTEGAVKCALNLVVFADNPENSD